MSRHHKNLTLDAMNDTWDEIGKQSRKLEQHIIEAHAAAIEDAVRIAKEKIAQAQRENERRMANAIRDLEDKTNKRLADLNRRHTENLQRVANQIYDEMNQGFDELSKVLENEVDNLNGRIDDMVKWVKSNLAKVDENIRQLQRDTNQRFNQQQQQIDSLQLSIREIYDRYHDEATMARDVAKDMTTLLQVVCENHPVKRYAPAELSEIQAHISDLLNSNYPAASIIAVADGIIRDILKMKEKTILEKTKHDQMLQQTKIRLTAVLKVIAANTNLTIEHDDDTASIATDYWTDDAYTPILKKLQDIERQLATEENDDLLSVEQIADLLKAVESLNIEGIGLMQKAISKAMQSQDRAEITLDIVNAMIRQGYVVKEENGTDAFDYMGGLEESDQREGVFAILQNPNTGEEITVLLRPNADDKTNCLDIHIDNPHQPITEQQLRRSMERVREEMQRSGYNPGPIEVPADGGNQVIPQMQSGAQMRKKGAAQKLRTSL